jgi:hypothetical protein
LDRQALVLLEQLVHDTGRVTAVVFRAGAHPGSNGWG